MNPNPIISENCRYRICYPNKSEDFKIGKYSIVDDYCYFSTRVEIGKFSHIASQVTIAGGAEQLFKCGDFGGLASGVRVYCASDDFVNDIANVLPSGLSYIKNNLIKGNVLLGDFCTVGANSVIMPDVHIPQGTCIGALSFVRASAKLQVWSVYATKHGKLVKVADRNRDNVLRQRDEILKECKL